jgi:hypothetical protein
VSSAQEHATSVLRDLLALFTLRKSKTLNVVFFAQLCGNRFPVLGWRLLPDIVRSVPAARSLFIALELLVITQDILRHAAQAVCWKPFVFDFEMSHCIVLQPYRDFSKTFFFCCLLQSINQFFCFQPNLVASLTELVSPLVTSVSHVVHHEQLQQRVKAKRLREMLHCLLDFARLLVKHTSAQQVCIPVTSTFSHSPISS